MSTVHLTRFTLFGFRNEFGEITKLGGFDCKRSVVAFGKMKPIRSLPDGDGYKMAQVRPGAAINERQKLSKGYEQLGGYFLNPSDGAVFTAPSMAKVLYGPDAQIVVDGDPLDAPVQAASSPKKDVSSQWTGLPLSIPGAPKRAWSL